MPLTKNLVGQRFGKLTVLRLSHTEPRKDRPTAVLRFWVCQCDCGTVKVIRGQDLGRTGSCRCVQKTMAAALLRTHGDTGSPEHRAWKEMLRRCRNRRRRNYRRYGGRGIKVCVHWADPKNGFENFLKAMGRMPKADMQLDRKNNDGDYEPSNCRWATRKTQCRNKSNNRRVTHDGKTLTVIEWSEQTGIPFNTLLSRLVRGWTPDRALTTPVRQWDPRN